MRDSSQPKPAQPANPIILCSGKEGAGRVRMRKRIGGREGEYLFKCQIGTALRTHRLLLETRDLILRKR
jgi:hypothetical protein